MNYHCASIDPITKKLIKVYPGFFRDYVEAWRAAGVLRRFFATETFIVIDEFVARLAGAIAT